MKKFISVILVLSVIAMLLAGGCKPKPGPETVQTGPEPEDDTIVTADDDDDVEPEPEPEPEMSEELKELLSGLSKIKSYKYAFQSGTADAKSYYIKGDKILVDLMQKRKWKAGENFEKILLDTKEKTAYAFCSDRSICSEEELSVAMKVSFSEYMPTILPYDFAKTMTHGDIIRSETINNQQCTIVEYEDQKGNTLQVCVSNYWGVPIRIVTITPSGAKSEVLFTEFAANSVKDTDVEFPEEIIEFKD